MRSDTYNNIVNFGLYGIPLALSHVVPELKVNNLHPLFSYSTPLILLASITLYKSLHGEFDPPNYDEQSRGVQAGIGMLNSFRNLASTLLIPLAGISSNIAIQQYYPILKELVGK